MLTGRSAYSNGSAKEAQRGADPSTPMKEVPMAALALTGNLSQYEGYRIRQIGQPHIYMILHGHRRHVPNPTTYSYLFGNDNNVHEVLDANIVPDGGPLSDGAILARPNNGPAIYLISNGRKQHVSS